MKVQLRRTCLSDPLAIEVVAETDADRVALKVFADGLRAPLTATFDCYVPGQPSGAEGLGPGSLRLTPASNEPIA